MYLHLRWFIYKFTQVFALVEKSVGHNLKLAQSVKIYQNRRNYLMKNVIIMKTENFLTVLNMLGE